MDYEKQTGLTFTFEPEKHAFRAQKHLETTGDYVLLLYFVFKK